MTPHILCIEDEPGLLEDVALELEEAGYVVTCAADGAAGLRALQTQDFGLVLCDVQIPELGGLEVLKAAADLGGGRARPPFFMLTAYSDQAVRERCAALGGARLVVKPIDYAQLLDLIAAELKQ